MFGGFFDMDKPFWRWVGKVPEIILLSLFWYICSLPIITIIPASCALFDAVSRNLMMDDKGSFTRFFRTFLRELKQGIPLSILWVFLGVVTFIGDKILLSTANGGIMGIYSVVYLVVILMSIAYLGWLVPLQSRYHNNFVGLHINAMKFFLGRLPGSGLILVSTVGVVIACLIHPYTYCLLVCAPCVIAILHTFPVEKGFMKAFPQDYEDGLPVYTEQDRAAIRAIKKAKQEEAEAAENEE